MPLRPGLTDELLLPVVVSFVFFSWWKHDVRLENILPLEERAPPVCIAGKGRGPVEDGGGPEVYQRMVTLSKRGPLKVYLNLCLNLGEPFNPTKFDRRVVNRKLKSGAWPEEIIRQANCLSPQFLCSLNRSTRRTSAGLPRAQARGWTVICQ